MARLRGQLWVQRVLFVVTQWCQGLDPVPDHFTLRRNREEMSDEDRAYLIAQMEKHDHHHHEIE